jgi:tetratricopeptide (TPR) repeat protein
MNPGGSAGRGSAGGSAGRGSARGSAGRGEQAAGSGSEGGSSQQAGAGQNQSVQPIAPSGRRFLLTRRLHRARQAQQAGNDEQAFERFEWVAEQDPGIGVATVAEAALETYRNDQAFMKQMRGQQAAKQAQGVFSLASSYEKAGREDLAMEKYREVVEKYPQTEQAAQAKKAINRLE